MSGINALNIAKDALLSHQTAINLTGTNIANSNTPGYTRQRPVFNASNPGVEIANIERVYDRFIGAQINDQMHNLGYGEARRDELDRIEMTFNEAGGSGINELLNKFWSSWEDLAANPSGLVEKQALVSVSQSLTSMFHSYNDELISVQDDVNLEIPFWVDKANNLASDIADINTRISQYQNNDMNGSGLNSLKDEMSNSLSELAGVVDFHYIENSDNSISIFLSNGMPLVEGDQKWVLDVVTENHASNSYFYDVVFQDDPDKKVINSVITNGRLAGFFEIRDNTVEDYLSRLNTLASSLVTEINTRHKLGYDVNQNLGGDFFDSTKTAAGDIEVSASVMADISKIAASETVNGDGGNAVRIGAVKDALLMNDGHSTLNSYYASIVGQIGLDVADVSRDFDRHTNLASQLKNKRESISGVSIDEEMMNLMKYQTGYNAAAKFFNAADELVDTLMSLLQ
jgi:flagellar hook-associated protein 1